MCPTLPAHRDLPHLPQATFETLLACLEAWTDGEPITLAGLAEELDRSKSTIRYHVERLRGAGYLKPSSGTFCRIALAHEARSLVDWCD